jgi:hypothetical protein
VAGARNQQGITPASAALPRRAMSGRTRLCQAGRMRQAFAHDAVLTMDADADLRAPGGAVTAALCGHWDHQPPCPLAPHHCRSDRIGNAVHVRILFVADQAAESVVRQRIESALSSEQLEGPDGVVTHWQLCSSRCGVLQEGEIEHAEHLIRS